jgi:hypothetical protein
MFMQRVFLMTVLTALGCASATSPAPGRVPGIAPDPARNQDAAREGEGPAVTIYSSADPAGFDPQQFIAQQRQGYNPQFAWQVPGFGVVKEVRAIALKPGLNEVRFTDVAQFIDPTTVSFADLTDPGGTAVLEQNFEFDLISPDKLYEKYIDRDVTLVSTRDGHAAESTGRVLAVNGGMFIIQTAGPSGGGIEFITQGSGQIKLPPLPLDGLVTKPTLVWKLSAQQPGRHQIRTAYQTSGMTWRADYNVVLNASDTKADVGAWVTLMNLSGAGYRDARLKLIAGDVQKVQPGRDLYRARMEMADAVAGAAAPGFEEKTFFEYHLYTLPRRTDILASATQQLTLFPTASNVAVEKVLVYYGLPEGQHWLFPAPQTDRNLGNQSNPKVDVYVRFRNEKENNLGVPLPKGKVRVYKQDDADGTLEFIGEDLIDHTPRDEEVLVKLGQAFDVVGERTQTNFTIDMPRRTITESYRIQIRNHKDAPGAVKVIIKENLFRWSNWQITDHSHEFEKVDSRTIHFTVEAPNDGEATVTYTVKYTW